MSEVIDTQTPTGGDTPVTSAPTTPSAPAVTTPATPTVAPTQAPATPGHEASVPSYRLRQIRDQYEQRMAQKEAEWQAKYEATQKQLHSLVGVTPPANPEVEAIRQQFGQLYPGLAKLSDPALVEKLLSVVDRAGDLEAQNQHYWQSYGRQSLDRLFSKASEVYGPLSEGAKAHLRGSFTDWVSSDPEISERYANDPSVVDDFWKAFSSSFIDPVRRTIAANVQDRVPSGIPQDTPSGPPRTSPPPQPANLDERVNLAWTQFNKTLKG